MIRPFFKFTCLSLALFAFSLPANAADTVSAAQKAQFETIIHDYLLSHPDVLVEGLNNYQKSQQDQEQKNFQSNIGKHKEALTSAGVPFAGNAKGTHTVIEFFDYNCGYCKHAVDDVVALVKNDPQAKIFLIDMPILSATSADASAWALAADKQHKYFEFHVALMHSTLQRDKQTYKKIAGELGLDTAKMEQDAESKEIKDAIAKNLDTARELGIHGTPAFIIGDKLSPGYMGADNLKKAVADAYPAGK